MSTKSKNPSLSQKSAHPPQYSLVLESCLHIPFEKKIKTGKKILLLGRIPVQQRVPLGERMERWVVVQSLGVEEWKKQSYLMIRSLMEWQRESSHDSRLGTRPRSRHYIWHCRRGNKEDFDESFIIWWVCTTARSRGTQSNPGFETSPWEPTDLPEVREGEKVPWTLLVTSRHLLYICTNVIDRFTVRSVWAQKDLDGYNRSNRKIFWDKDYWRREPFSWKRMRSLRDVNRIEDVYQYRKSNVILCMDSVNLSIFFFILFDTNDYSMVPLF